MAIKLKINGIDRSDRIYYGQSMSWTGGRGVRGQCSIGMVMDPTDSYSPVAEDLIEIYDPDTVRVWAGLLEEVGCKWLNDPGWRVMTITGVTLEQEIDTAYIDKIQYAKAAGVAYSGPYTAGDIFSDLFSKAASEHLSLGTVDTGVDVESLEVTQIAQGWDTVALLSQFIWYVDPSDLSVYFQAPNARNVGFTLGSEDILWSSIDWKQSRQDFRDKQVLQIPDPALPSTSETFAGNGATTIFTLAHDPVYVMSITILPGGNKGNTIEWIPGSKKIKITVPPLTVKQSVVVKYVTGDQIIRGDGSKRAARYTQTRSFTKDGVIQETVALLAAYNQLPSQLSVSTFRPGIGVGRILPISVVDPQTAGPFLNGNWMVQEIQGELIPGLDFAPPSTGLARFKYAGHFRYTARLINYASAAVFQGDGSTTSFDLGLTPDAVSSIRISSTDGTPRVGAWLGGSTVSVTPALASGDSVTVDHSGGDGSAPPNVPSDAATWDNLARKSEPAPIPLSGSPPGPDPSVQGGAGPFIRTFTIYDSTPRVSAGPHTTFFNAGFSWRVTGVLRKVIASDLTVLFRKNDEELMVATIPNTTAVDTVLEWPLSIGSPPLAFSIEQDEILKADIIESDSQKDDDGIAQFTVEWTL